MTAPTRRRPPLTARVIRDDAEALRTAAELAEEFRPGACGRDARRELPRAELDRLTATGLLAVTVPAEHGGADVSAVTLAEVFRLLASADASLAQIPQSHFAYVNVLRQLGSPEQRAFFFAEVLAGRRFGNAQSEAGTKHLQDIRTRLVAADAGAGSYLLTGVKNYSTGALFADWIPVLARAEDDLLHVAYVPADAPGLTVTDDWDGMGQRTTASGTVELADVVVPAAHVVPHHLTFTGPQLHGALAQLLHAAIDAGIAAGALAEAAEFVRVRAGPGSRAGTGPPPRTPSSSSASANWPCATGPPTPCSPPPRGPWTPHVPASTTTARPRRRSRSRRRRRTRGARRWRSPTRCSRCPGREPPSTASTCTGTGVTPAPTRCTTRRAGRSSTSAGTC